MVLKQLLCFHEFVTYSALNVLGMMGLSCYILADTFFVALGLGADGLAALNLAIPIYSFIHGAGLMFGMGGAIQYSILKSRGDAKGANRVYTRTLLLALGLAGLFFVLGILWSGALATMLGADENVFAMTRTYIQVLLLFAPMFMVNNVLLCFVRNDGAPQLAMMAMVGGSLSNILLDYIFIFPLGMGIFGAVLATGLAPIISMAILAPFFARGRNRFHLARGPLPARRAGAIVSGGVPSLIAEVSSGIVMIVFNGIILRLEGNTGVAAYGVIANLSLVVLSIFTGIAQGIQPLVSRNHGMGNGPAVQAILRYALITTISTAIGIYGIVFFGAAPIAGIFNSERNALLHGIAVEGLRIYFIAGAFAGWNIILSAYFASMELPRPAHIIAVLRGFLLVIPMAFLLSILGGMRGVWCAFPATEAIVAGVGWVLLRVTRTIIGGRYAPPSED